MAGAGKTCLICIGMILIIAGVFIFRFFLPLVIIGIILLLIGVCSSRKASKSIEKTPITTTTQSTSALPNQSTLQKTPEQKVETVRFCSLCGAKTTGEYCPDCGAKVE